MYRLMSAFSVVLVACSPGAPKETMTLEQRTAEIAHGMNAIAPKDLGGGLTILSVTSEGKTLVLSIRGLQAWRPHVSDAEVAKVLGASLCQSEKIQAAVRDGGLFRIDGSTAEGKPLPKLYICGGNPPTIAG